jgi:hypothetical protein
VTQDFAIQADLQVRYTRGWACLPLGIAAVVFMAGFVITISPFRGRRVRLEDVDWFGVILLALAALIFVGTLYQLRDRGVKLLLTTTGLEDYRDGGVSIKWTDVYGVRLVITTLVPSGEVLRALIVKAPVGDEIKDIVIDLKHLNVPAETIADFAHQRSLKALDEVLARAARSGAVTIEGLRAELTAGRALSDVTNTLRDQVRDPQLAKRAVELVAGFDLARCRHCRLTYLRCVPVCGACGEQLKPFDPSE